MLRAVANIPTGYLGSGTFAQMKALTGMADTASYLVTNYGRGGSLWRYCAASSDWFPTAPVLSYENTATITGVAQTGAQVLLAMPMEAGLLANKRFRVLTTLAKGGTTDTITPALRMGNAGTASDAGIATLATVSGSTRSLGDESWFRMASSTSVIRIGGSPASSFSQSGTTSLLVNAAATVADVGSANFVTITCTSSGTTDTPQLGYCAVEILP